MAYSKRMQEIIDRSGKPSYAVEPRENEKAASRYKSAKDAERSSRTATVQRVVGPYWTARTGAGKAAEKSAGGVAKGMATKAAAVLKIVPVPVVYPEIPDDLFEYNLPPATVVVPYEIMPNVGSIAAVIPLIGSLLVYAGKKLLVSLAITTLESAVMEPLYQKAQKGSDIAIRYKTGNSGKKGSTRVGPRAPVGTGPQVNAEKTLGNTSDFGGWAEGNFLGVGKGD